MNSTIQNTDTGSFEAVDCFDEWGSQPPRPIHRMGAVPPALTTSLPSLESVSAAATPDTDWVPSALEFARVDAEVELSVQLSAVVSANLLRGIEPTA